ncbi:hypothetical protein POTOM_019886 [Populus tomentosa]|uniref:G protein gamma domain-containing protein n=1 Tax=Populus tomentosa TaxID=118781 RepID=A0A8X8A8C2_POPTO|nr:hypothetical protein POTOM_019886 [Populus tomentosa]
MESETASSVDEQVSGGVGGGGGGGGGTSAGADTRGKHRILAELKRVEQEIKFLEEELEELEKTDNVSTVCEELLRNMENIPDPLLSLTNGPANPLWDRWFEGPQKSQGCVCRIL